MSNYDEKEIIQMINDCADRESKLTDWESGFIASIGDMADKGMMLSEKQRERLDAIWTRIT